MHFNKVLNHILIYIKEYLEMWQNKAYFNYYSGIVNFLLILNSFQIIHLFQGIQDPSEEQENKRSSGVITMFI